jgi:hypothetical protein
LGRLIQANFAAFTSVIARSRTDAGGGAVRALARGPNGRN